MKIKMTKPILPDIDDIKDQFAECLETGQVTNNGKYVQVFEEKLQEFLDSRLKPICFCNGEMALFNLIRAYKIKNNIPDYSSVLVPSFTFVGTINAIVLNGLKPLFCDVDKTLTIDIDRTEADNFYGDKIKMVVAVGVYGNLPDFTFIQRICHNAFNIPIIYDLAPAFGSTYKGEYPKGELIYSFHATKTFNTMEGGCALTEDEDIRQILIELRDFGQYEKVHGDVRYPGLNSKMMEICAIIGLHNLQNIELENAKRQNIAKQYNEFFKTLPVGLMQVDKDVVCNYLYFPIILPDDHNDQKIYASDFVLYMEQNDIQVRRYYTACHTLTAYNKKPIELCQNSYSENIVLPFTDSIKDNIVSLPIHSDMTEAEIKYLFDTIKNYFK